jgi:hypothetical protein
MSLPPHHSKPECDRVATNPRNCSTATLAAKAKKAMIAREAVVLAMTPRPLNVSGSRKKLRGIRPLFLQFVDATLRLGLYPTVDELFHNGRVPGNGAAPVNVSIWNFSVASLMIQRIIITFSRPSQR